MPDENKINIAREWIKKYLIDSADAAHILQCSTRKISDLVRMGHLTHTKGKFFLYHDVIEYKRELKA